MNYEAMATKRKLKQKGSTAQNEENKSKDLQVLELAKEQENKRRLKTVRIDRQTIIFVDVNKCSIKAVEEYREKLKRYESNH